MSPKYFERTLRTIVILSLFLTIVHATQIKHDAIRSRKGIDRKLLQKSPEQQITVSQIDTPQTGDNGKERVPSPSNSTSSSTNTSALSPISDPFHNDTNSSLVCCCPGYGGAMVYLPYQKPTPNGCCCGNKYQCCGGSPPSIMTTICAGGQLCGVLMLCSALIGVIFLAICVVGAFLAHRRRRHDVNIHLQQSQAAAAAAAAAAARQNQRYQLQQPIDLPVDQLDVLKVKEPDQVQCGIPTECSICLDTVIIQSGTWVTFPCSSHGCCKSCFDNLLRHSARLVNASTVAVACPLCRKLAVTPRPPSLLLSPLNVNIGSVNDTNDRRRLSSASPVVTPSSPTRTGTNGR